MLKHVCCLAAVTGIGLSAAAVQGSVVAYYQFDGSMASAANSPAQDATKTSSATYVPDAPGGVVYDGVGGPIVNAANTQSYRNGADTSGSSAPSAAVNSAVTTGSFTVEAFIKMDAAPTSMNFDAIMGNGDDGAKAGWAFGLNGSGRLQFYAYQLLSSAGGGEYSATDLSRDQWHHVAAVGTYNGASKVTTIHLYEDYVAITPAHEQNFYGTAANGPTINANASNFKIGAPNPFSGLIDEIRISNTALTPDQMLHVPEPGTLTLCGLAGMLALGRRRRIRTLR
jgi:hypothetical protein